MAKGFTKFSGCYTCEVCKRQTRENKDSDATNVKLCDQCYELAGMENEISDGMATLEEHRERALELIAQIKAKGGKTDQWADFEAAPPKQAPMNVMFANWSQKRTSTWHLVQLDVNEGKTTFCGKTMKLHPEWAHAHKPADAKARFCEDCIAGLDSETQEQLQVGPFATKSVAATNVLGDNQSNNSTHVQGEVSTVNKNTEVASNKVCALCGKQPSSPKRDLVHEPTIEQPERHVCKTKKGCEERQAENAAKAEAAAKRKATKKTGDATVKREKGVALEGSVTEKILNAYGDGTGTSPADVAKALSEELGRTVRYQQVYSTLVRYGKIAPKTEGGNS